MRMALDYDSSRLQASYNAANENGAEQTNEQGMDVTDSLEQSGHPILELDEPRSYARYESSPEEKEHHRQAKMLETARRFTTPGGGGEIAQAPTEGEQGFTGRIPTRPRSQAGQGNGDQMDQYRRLEEEKAKKAVDLAGKVASRAGGPLGMVAAAGLKVEQEVFGSRAIIAMAAKGGGAMGVPLWYIFCVNLEALNVLMPFIRVSPQTETTLLLLGLDVSQNKKAAYKLLTLAHAMLLDLAILAVLCLIAGVLFAIVYLITLPLMDKVRLFTGL